MSYPDPVDTLARTQRLLMQAQAQIKRLEKELAGFKKVTPSPVKEPVPEPAIEVVEPEVLDSVPKKKKKNGPTE